VVRGDVWVGLIWLVGMIASWRVPGSTLDKPASPGKKERVLRPRTPDDCGLCRAEGGPTDGNEVGGQCERVVRPWAEVKGRRGRRKRARMEGYACPNKGCEYCGITDTSVHVLVGYGRHGKCIVRLLRHLLLFEDIVSYHPMVRL
jgi:hypothetical protein